MELRTQLRVYQAFASIVGVLLIILCLIGLPLHWAHQINEAWFPVGSTGEQLGADISAYLGVAHGWLYMLFLLAAFMLARKAEWPVGFTVVTLLLGTVPILSFWAERRATRRTQETAMTESSPPSTA